MEKKKTIKETTSKVKPKTKKTTTKKTVTKKTTKKRKTKGFTLIELLAVIIILGVLMIIAIPSVTTYISNSRKSSYVDTVKNLVGAARNLVNSGKVQAYDRNTTYYIPSKCLPMENGASTPYGEFTEAYVVVTYNGNGYNYYWTGTDSSHTGVKKLIPVDKLNEDNIEPNIEDTDIKNNTGVENRDIVSIIDKDSCDYKNPNVVTAAGYVNSDGSEVVPQQLIAPGDYPYENGYYYIGYSTNSVQHSGYYCYDFTDIMTVPSGATEFKIYYSSYWSNGGSKPIPTNIEEGYWRPITVQNGTYSYITSNGGYWRLEGDSGYIPLTTQPFTQVSYDGMQLNNQAVGMPTNNNVPLSMYVRNGKLQISSLCTQGQDGYFIKIKYNGPRYEESSWYVYHYYLYKPCIEANMEVEVYDEKKKKRLRKKIKDVTYDDLLLVWDFDNAEFTWAKPLWIKKIEKTDKYNLLKFSDGSELKLVGDHRIFNVEKKMFTLAMTDETPIGTTTLNSKGELVTLVSKEEIIEKCEFCNIITNRHINLFTNGILTSWGLNNLYPIEDLKFVKDDRKLRKREEFEELDDAWFDGIRVSESKTNKEKILKEVAMCKKLQK